MALISTKEGRVMTITINRPAVYNAFDPETADELSEALVEFRDDADAWVAIITGAGKSAFSAGFDLKTLVPGSKPRPTSDERSPSILDSLHLTKPLIAAVNGIAFGMGFEVALACDIRIAADNATFGLPEVKWGLIPGGGGTQRLPRMLPRAKAAEMLMLGTSINAEEAYRLGLVNAVVPFAELLATARRWADTICDNGPLAVRAVKEAMIIGLDKQLNDGIAFEKELFARLAESEDSSEGPKAFAEKRKPVFRGT